jgi:hypothetical protein
MRNCACVAAALAGALACAAVHGETLYVIDELIIGVSSTADESGERVASIHSGDSVEVLDRHDAYARVRLSSGTEGWVKTSYLSSELPLQQKLTTRDAELGRLKAEVSRLQDAASAAQARASAARPVPVDPPVPTPDERLSLRPIWQWALGSTVLALLGGFALGWRMLDRRIRRKFGGLRIY